MKNRYEALLIIDTKGKEDAAKDIIARIEKVFEKQGARVEQVQRLDRRQFTYSAGALDHGYYVNFIFEGEPTVIEKLKAAFLHDEEVYRQHYIKLKKTAAPAEAAA